MKTISATTLLKLSVFLIFFGRAWQHLFWDAPYRSFFWDEALLKSLVENVFNMPWREYVTSSTTDNNIQIIIKTNGLIYLMASIFALIINKKNLRWLKIPIVIGGILLIILALLLTKEKFYHGAQFFEHSIQFGLPFALLYMYYKKMRKENLYLFLKIIIAITFFSHGLYAFGFYPVPGSFVDMVIQIFGCTEPTAILFLHIAGIIDFIIALLIFIPKTTKYALWYAMVWGLLTAFARIVANFYIDFPIQSIHQNLHETLYRLPHGLTPAILLLFLKASWNGKLKKKFNKTTA